MNTETIIFKRTVKYYNDCFIADARLQRKQKERFFGKPQNNHKYGKIKR